MKLGEIKQQWALLGEHMTLHWVIWCKSTIMAEKTTFLVRRDWSMVQKLHKHHSSVITHKRGSPWKSRQRRCRSREHHVREAQRQCESSIRHETHQEIRKRERPITRPGQWAKGHVWREKAVRGRKGESRQDRPVRQRWQPWEDTSPKSRHRQQRTHRTDGMSKGWTLGRDQRGQFPHFLLVYHGPDFGCMMVHGENVLECPIAEHFPIFIQTHGHTDTHAHVTAELGQ